jgi:hypothetical protein
MTISPLKIDHISGMALVDMARQDRQRPIILVLTR